MRVYARNAYIHFFAFLDDNVLRLWNKRNKELKMAAVAIMRTYFRVVIYVSEETARTFIDQGLDDFDYLVEFTKADMRILCMTIRFPGGMIINLRANITDQPTTICNPGHLISIVA